MTQLFLDLKQQLLDYKKAAPEQRQQLLATAATTIRKLSSTVVTTEEAKTTYTQMAYAATLINYADNLRRMENQQYFDILVDFYNMTLPSDLQDYFEFGSFGQMRLKKPLNEYTPQIWEQFRQTQLVHLQKIGKNKTFDLSQFDPNTPSDDLLYPIMAQMGGKLNNEAVDRIAVSHDGYIRFAKRFGAYLLPGGGMVEIKDASKLETFLIKMLDEHLEEEQANLYQTAAPLYDNLEQNQFNATLMTTLSAHPQLFIQLLTNADKNNQHQVLIQQIAALNAQISEIEQNIKRQEDTIKTLKKAGQPSTEIDATVAQLKAQLVTEQTALKTMITSSDTMGPFLALLGATSNAGHLTALISQVIDPMIEAAKTDAKKNQNLLKDLAETRAAIQVQTFKHTSLYRDACQHITANTKMFDIQQYGDTRVLASTQMSHSFIMLGQSLEDYFREKLGHEGEFGDDIAGSEIKRLTLLQAIAEFRKVKFSHLLIGLAGYLESGNAKKLDLTTTWDETAFTAAQSALLSETDKLMRLSEHELKQQQLARKAIEYNHYFEGAESKQLKDKLKVWLKTQCASLPEGKKIAINLVDIQNDFVLEDFALYAPAGGHTILSNMALLDAIADLIKGQADIAQKIEIITSQDAHLLGRTPDSPDAELMAKAYGEKVKEILAAEQGELKPVDFTQQQYGLHCINGTIGAAIAKPIEDRLQHLAKNCHIAVHRFGKVNFSAPKAGMKLKADVDLSNPRYSQDSIFDPAAITYSQFIQNQHYSQVLVTGICGDICVKQAAEGLSEQGEKVTVIDSCVHYLIDAKKQSLAEVEAAALASYKEKGITYHQIPGFPANPEYSQSLRRIDTLLAELQTRITTLGEATPNIDTAKTLLTMLQTSRKIYIDDLSSSKHPATAAQLFVNNCQAAINQSLDTLEPLLDWGTYLRNLAKQIANAFIAVFTLGTQTQFFTPAYSEPLQTVKDTENDIREWEKEELRSKNDNATDTTQNDLMSCLP